MRMVVSFWLTMLAVAAFGYDVNSAQDTWVGNGITMRFCPSTLTSLSTYPDYDLWLEADVIMKGFRQWNAGPGFRIRGADWEFTRGTDKYTTCALGNFANEVYAKDQAWFDTHGWGYASARTQLQNVAGTDIIFNSNELWADIPVQELAGLEKSLPDTAMHEMGHVVGFNHEESHVSTMSAGREFDMGRGRYRIREDDYEGLADIKPDSSTGVNLMLSRFVTTYPSSDPPSASTEDRWDGNATAYSVASGTTADVGNDLPYGVNVVVHGTGSHTIEVWWAVSESPDCFNNTRWYVGFRTTTVAANTEYVIEPETPYPNKYNFLWTPPGDYYMCAKVDPWDSVSETFETDNRVVTDFTIEVTP